MVSESARQPSKPQTDMKRILEIDILRTFATLLLLLHHSGYYQFRVSGVRLKHLIRIPVGFALLGIFIFLSGYLVGYYIRRKGPIKLGQYYSRRILRLFPPYIFSLILYREVLGIQLEGVDFWIHFFGLQILLAPMFSRPIITLWYVGLLILCLLIVPPILNRFKKVSYSSLAFVALFILATIIHEQYRLIDIRFFYFFWIFSLGALIGRYYTSGMELLKHPLSIITSIIIVSLTGYRLFKSQNSYYDSFHWGHLLWATTYMISFIHLAFLAASSLKRMSNVKRLATWISGGTYFTYILHRPIWDLLIFFFPYTSDPATFSFKIFVGSPIVIFLSAKLQPVYERWITKPGKRKLD